MQKAQPIPCANVLVQSYCIVIIDIETVLYLCIVMHVHVNFVRVEECSFVKL